MKKASGPLRRKPLREAREPQSKGAVQAVDRAMRILEVIAEAEAGMSLSEITERSGLSASTVHRILTTMEERRFVMFDAAESAWRIGRQAHSVGASFARRNNFIGAALPFLRALRDKTRETINLGIAEAGEVVILHQVESREIVRAITRPGGRIPMTSSGLGKAIMAHYATPDIGHIVKTFGLRRLTPKSIVRADDLFAALHRIRQDGYALDDEEANPGLRCVASAVFNSDGEPLCAISLSAPAARISDERFHRLGHIVAQVAVAITQSLGGIVPEHKDRESDAAALSG